MQQLVGLEQDKNFQDNIEASLTGYKAYRFVKKLSIQFVNFLISKVIESTIILLLYSYLRVSYQKFFPYLSRGQESCIKKVIVLGSW